MKRSRLALAAATVLLLVALSLSWAHGGGRGGGGGGEGLSPEQLLGYLALSPDIMLTDEQLLNARNVLRASYAEHLSIRNSMGGGNNDVREAQRVMAELQKTMTDAVSVLLSKDQRARMKTGIEQTSSRGRGRGRR